MGLLPIEGAWQCVCLLIGSALNPAAAKLMSCSVVSSGQLGSHLPSESALIL